MVFNSPFPCGLSVSDTTHQSLSQAELKSFFLKERTILLIAGSVRYSQNWSIDQKFTGEEKGRDRQDAHLGLVPLTKQAKKGICVLQVCNSFKVKFARINHSVSGEKSPLRNLLHQKQERNNSLLAVQDMGIRDCCDGRAARKPASRVTRRSIMGNTSNNVPRMLIKSEISAKVEKKIPLLVPLTHKGQGTAKVRRQQKTQLLQTSKEKQYLLSKKGEQT